jgi:hypothetical protein
MKLTIMVMIVLKWRMLIKVDNMSFDKANSGKYGGPV